MYALAFSTKIHFKSYLQLNKRCRPILLHVKQLYCSIKSLDCILVLQVYDCCVILKFYALPCSVQTCYNHRIIKLYLIIM